MALNTKATGFYADFASLAALKGSAHQQDPKALREAARQFESLFTQMMLKSMRQANLGGSMLDSDQSNFYRDMFDDQMALQMSKGKGLGLADVLVRQLQGAAGDVTPDSGLETRKSLQTPGALQSFPKPATHSIRSVVGPALPFTTSELLDGRQPATISSTKTSEIAKVSPNSLAPKNSEAAIASSPAVSATTPSSGAMPADSPTVTALEKRPLPLSSTPAEFVAQLWPHAEKAARELGVDPHMLIAHAALETGWGKFVPCNPDGTCSFNLFGIKSGGRWQGPAVGVNTVEFEGGVAVQRRASFRAYDSPADSFRDYAALIKNSPRYAAAVGSGDDAHAFATALQQGGYATDPEYASKLTATAGRLKATLTSMGHELPLKTMAALPLASGRSVASGDRT